jgi:uncharacterized membrane protein YdfJ with MMPL/SSD domain
MSSVSTERSKIAHAIRVLAVPIVLGWMVLTVVTNVFVPSLEKVGEAQAVSMNAHDAPAFIAMQRIGANFQEFDSDSNAMVILEGDKPLGDEAHHYYDGLIKAFRADSEHVEHVADFWSDPLTAAGAQSSDGKSAYVQLYLRGNMGETRANESIAAVRETIELTPSPPGVKSYVTGGAAMNADQRVAGDKGAAKATLVTLVVIFVMLLVVYRSIATTILILLMVFIELGASRGIVAFLGNAGVMGLSTFATSLLTLIAIAAGTDYAIFLIGRYQEARGDGEDRETAYYTMFRGTAHVVLGSGLTIAGALLCLKFTRLPWFQTMAVPCAVGILVAVLAALTLGPAVIVIGGRFGLFEPKRAINSRGWRRIGVVVVRWPGPILVATCALALIGLLALPGYKTDYDGRHFMPEDTPANIGYAVADRHFDSARMNPELMMVESDHDLRNSADFLVIDKIAKALFRVPGIARVQTITRPDGKPIEHTTIPFLLGMQDQMAAQQENSSAMGDAFDDSMNDDSFYLPPEVFENEDFKRGIKNFISPDGKSVRFIIEHDGDPATPEGIERIDALKQAAKEAIKGTPLEGSTIFLGGTAATYKDMRDGSNYDLLIAGLSAAALIFIIMLLITRSVVASAVIVGTVLLSLGTSFGLSVLVWQYLLGIRLHWIVLVMSVILLLAVGSDYNLLLVSRFKEELHHGLKTAIIRAMAGSGSVVTSAGLVFAATMASFVFGDLLSIAQVGSTIALGLLFDTLIVRSFMTPSIAALMGRWFWWPQVPQTPASKRRMQKVFGDRGAAVRS